MRDRDTEDAMRFVGGASLVILQFALIAMRASRVIEWPGWAVFLPGISVFGTVAIVSVAYCVCLAVRFIRRLFSDLREDS